MSQIDAPDTAPKNAVGRLAWYIVDSDAREYATIAAERRTDGIADERLFHVFL